MNKFTESIEKVEYEMKYRALSETEISLLCSISPSYASAVRKAVMSKNPTLVYEPIEKLTGTVYYLGSAEALTALQVASLRELQKGNTQPKQPVLKSMAEDLKTKLRQAM